MALPPAVDVLIGWPDPPSGLKTLTPPETGRVLIAQISQHLLTVLSWRKTVSTEVSPPSGVSLILTSEAAS